MVQKFKILLLSNIFFIISSCNSLTGTLGISNDIKDAKRRNVFISEYTPTMLLNHNNDSIKIKFDQIWLEKVWYYSDDLDESIPINEYQLVVNTRNKLKQGIGITWTIGVDSEKYLRECSDYGLVSTFKSKPRDTIEFIIKKGCELNSEIIENNIIGRLLFINKKHHQLKQPNTPPTR